MIVLEGPDGSGKTRLAHDLCELYALEYRRPPKEVLSSEAGPDDTGASTALIDWWREEVDKCRKDPAYARSGVYDRTTYISDVIYRLAMGGKPQGTPDKMMNGVWYLANYAKLLCFCLPPFEVTLENINREGRPAFVVDAEKLYNIWWAYHWVYHLFKEVAFEATAKYDYTQGEGEWWRIKNFVGQNILNLSIHDTIGKG